MARIMDSKRQIAVRMAHMIQLLPDEHPELDGLKGLLSSSSQVSKSVIAYLNSLAELEEAMADSLTQLIKANDDSDEE
nr:nucleoside-diphosphate sugar epimerase [Cohnella thailandensis]